MAANTVEATLRSKFEDGITRGVENTQKLLASTFASMRSAGAVGSAAFQGVFDTALGSLESYRQRLQQASEESQTGFGKMGFAAAAFTTVLIAGLIKAGKAVADFFVDLVKESSKALEVKIAFESLTASLNLQADVIQNKLKRATEGQISSTVLLQNANRVLQSHVPITIDQYAKLTENVFRLSKAAGADTSQAMNILTDAVVRGNSRALQSVGIHIAVKDAISAMAEATGESTANLADESRLRAFYNEMLQKTEKQVQSLGPAFLTVEDILTQSEVTWRQFLSSIGQAIGRSAVLQELIGRLSEGLLEFGASKESLDGVTLAANRFFISALEGAASVIEIQGALRTAWDAVYGFIKAATEGLFIIVSGFLYYFTAVFGYLFSWAAKLPGIGTTVRTTLRALSDELFEASRRFVAIKWEFEKDPAFVGFGEGQKKLNALADSARALAAEMAKYSAEIKRGAAGTTDHGDAAAKAAAKQKEMNEQLQKYADLRRELAGRTATPEQAALLQLTQDFEKIDQLTLVSEERRNQLKIQALMAYDAKRREIEERRNAEEARATQEMTEAVAQAAGSKEAIQQMADFVGTITGETQAAQERWWAEFTAKMAKQREEQRAKEVNEAIAAANAIQRAVDLSRKGTIDPAIGTDALTRVPQVLDQIRRKIAELNQMRVLTAAQIEDLEKLKTMESQLRRVNLQTWQRPLAELHDQLQSLNRISMDPFHQMLAGMQLHITDFAGQAGQAFASFFADLVSSQEGAGKKLLAAFVGMIGQMLVKVGVMLIQVGVAEIALAQTMVGRWLGASTAAGVKAIATGAILAAVGGALMGAASAMAQTNQAGAGGSFQQDVPRPTSSTQVPVIDVGAARGAQNPGQAAAPQPVTGEIRIRIEPSRDYVVRQVENDIRSNGRLRVVMQNA